jgi:hypothetical protein
LSNDDDVVMPSWEAVAKMSPDTWPAVTELDERLAVIEVAASHFVGVNEIEHLLVDVTGLLQSERLEREQAVSALTRLATEWPWGAVEVLEFSLRALQWPELRDVLEHHAATGLDFRTRDMAKHVLEVYADEWPTGEIYRVYR